MVTKDKYEVIQSPEEAAIIVKSTKKLVFTLTIHLTSPLVRSKQESQPSEPQEEEEEEEGGTLLSSPATVGGIPPKDGSHQVPVRLH